MPREGCDHAPSLDPRHSSTCVKCGRIMNPPAADDEFTKAHVKQLLAKGLWEEARNASS